MPIKKNIIEKEVKKSLILAGGGMRLAYQAGVLIALEEQGITFNHIDGTSGGIFNAAMLASGLGANEIADRWRNLDIKNFMSIRPLKKYFKPFSMMGYADADGIRNKIFPDLGIDIMKVNSNQFADITFNVCNFSDKCIEAIHNKKVTLDHLIAGVSLPIVMPAIKINENWYSDAVWIKDANLIEAVKQGSEELWLIWAIGNTKTYLSGALNQYVHMIEMSANGGLLEEYERIQMINEQIKNGNRNYSQKSTIKLFVTKPEFPLPLDPDFFINKIDARSLINMGYAHSKKNLHSIPENGVSFDQGATKMSDPGTRLNIRMKFQGFLDQGELRHSVFFYAYFVFSNHSNASILQIYSSISIDLFKAEIPCFNHMVKTRKVDDRKVLICDSEFIFKEEVYSMTAIWYLNSEIDILLGLGFKSVQLSISKNKNSDSNYEGVLYQNIKQRLLGVLSTNVRKFNNEPGSLKRKYKMLSKLVSYEV